MKKLLFILLLTIPFFGFGQNTGYHVDHVGSIHKTTDSVVNWTLQYDFPLTEQGIRFIKNNITYSSNIITQPSNRKMEKVVDVLGRETKPQTNTPFI